MRLYYRTVLKQQPLEENRYYECIICRGDLMGLLDMYMACPKGYTHRITAFYTVYISIDRGRVIHERGLKKSLSICG